MLQTVFCRKALGAALLLAVLAVTLTAASAGHAAVEVISLRYRNATEVLPLAKSMLSPEGKISADDRTNSLIIVDSEETVARVKQALAAIDTPVRKPRCACVSRRARRGRSAPCPEGAGFPATTGRCPAAAAAQPGRGGCARAGPQCQPQRKLRILHHCAFGQLGLHPGRPGHPLHRSLGGPVPPLRACRGFQRIETGFDVKPVIRENLADVEIVPRISEMGSGGPQGAAVRFAEASTRPRYPWASGSPSAALIRASTRSCARSWRQAAAANPRRSASS